jgi:hypothetical protein
MMATHKMTRDALERIAIIAGQTNDGAIFRLAVKQQAIL